MHFELDTYLEILDQRFVNENLTPVNDGEQIKIFHASVWIEALLKNPYSEDVYGVKIMKRNNQSVKDMVINRITSFPYNKAIYYDRLDIMIFAKQFVFDFYNDKQRFEKHSNAKKLFNMVRRYVINYLNDSDIKRMHKGHDCFTYVANECEIVYICKPHREFTRHVKVNYALAVRDSKLKDKCR